MTGWCDQGMTPLDAWSREAVEHGGVSHDTYRRGVGPGVVLIHEIPGMTPAVIGFADEVVDHGFTVVMPHLFGTPGAGESAATMAKALGQVCVSREFTLLATGRPSPVTRWLRALAASLHAELGGPGVGALGMCLTGGFALAMMVDDAVAAPVLAQPSLPFAIGARRSADLGLAPSDLARVKARVQAGCPVMGLRYQGDRAVGARFDTLARELGDGFIAVEFPGSKHSTLTAHRQQEGVERVLGFFDARLRADT